MLHRLQPIIFDPAVDADIVRDFSCGSEYWATAASDWIRGERVVNSMARGTRVWLYKLSSSDLVGFGSLGRTGWKVLPREKLAFIPQLAIQTAFQGRKPSDAPPEERFAHQIMKHLLGEASKQPDVSFVVLEVHQENSKAISLYQQYDFVMLSVPVVKEFDGERHTYRQMARAFR